MKTGKTGENRKEEGTLHPTRSYLIETGEVGEPLGFLSKAVEMGDCKTRPNFGSRFHLLFKKPSPTDSISRTPV
jgi:hypothetical protein